MSKILEKEKPVEEVNRTIVQERYRFLEEPDERGKPQHRHQLLINGEWRDLIGVSSVVKDITNFSVASYYGSRRALMNLGYDPKEANEEVKAFRDKVASLSILDDEDLSKELYEAYTAHADYAKQRAGKGTNSHDKLDKWVKDCIAKNEGFPMASDEPLVKKFIDMTKHLEPQFVASEKHGYNEELWLGGITDLIVMTNIGLGIWDYKDRPAIYEKDILQMGGYAHLFDIDFTHVLGVPLEGEEPRVYYDLSKLKNAYAHQLEVYKFLESLKPKQYDK